jgi:catechol 2,3-dioxygenase-like lactoylglutathione lyase family enzyme
MFTHIMIGSNNLERAKAFYDATFVALGGKPGEMDARGRLIYAHEGSRLMVTTPIDSKPATVANGGTIGIAAGSPDHVLAWHKAGTTNGAQRSRARPPSARTGHSLPIFAIPTEINYPHAHCLRIETSVSSVGTAAARGECLVKDWNWATTTKTLFCS